jgi:hypothetical protein
MTGHDLDLDEAVVAMHAFIAEQVGFDGGDEMDRQAEEAVARVAPLIARDLRAKLAAAEQERDAERLVAEQALAGNVDPVSVIVAIVHECLSNRRAVAAVREAIERVRTLLYGTQAIRDIDAALAAAEQDEPKRGQS